MRDLDGCNSGTNMSLMETMSHHSSQSTSLPPPGRSNPDLSTPTENHERRGLTDNPAAPSALSGVCFMLSAAGAMTGDSIGAERVHCNIRRGFYTFFSADCPSSVLSPRLVHMSHTIKSRRTPTGGPISPCWPFNLSNDHSTAYFRNANQPCQGVSR